MIVEDEYWIREGLIGALDWQQHGLKVVAEAEDGDRGLELALELRPHVIFADVRMPGLDGIQMAERILQEMPDTKIVIISGYDDYAYTRQSILLGISDYLIKPVDADQLEKLVERLVEELNGQELRKLQEIERRYELTQSRRRHDADVLLQLLAGHPEPIRRKENEQLLRWFRYDRYQVALVRIENVRVAAREYYSGDEHAVHFVLENIAGELAQPSTLFFQRSDDPHEFVVLLGCSDADAEPDPGGEDTLRAWCERLALVISSFRKMVINIGIGGIVPSMEGAARSFQEASQSLGSIGIQEQFRIRSAHERAEARRLPLLDQLEERFQELLERLQPKRMEEFLQLAFEQIRRDRALPRSLLHAFLLQLLRRLERTLDLSLPESPLFIASADLGATLRRLESLQDIERWFTGNVLFQLDVVRKMKLPEAKEMMPLIRDYMEAHFFSDEISLEQLSKKFFMSPYQISRLFKTEFGENLQNYLMRIRLEKAKQYLETSSLPVHDIAELVGYQDVKYFFRIFKKWVGTTPAEYRKKVHLHPQS
jgi:two-component system response regulator YesN